MAMPKRQNLHQQRLSSVVIPPLSTPSSNVPITPTTPKTPADEGIEFFQSQFKSGDAPIRVYELHLDIDGGPHKDRSVRAIPILHVSVDG